MYYVGHVGPQLLRDTISFRSQIVIALYATQIMSAMDGFSPGLSAPLVGCVLTFNKCRD